MAEDTPCVIGEGIQISGNLTGSGDLIVQGRIEGSIDLQDNLSVEESGTVVADVASRTVTLHGRMSGDVRADEVAISSTALVQGDLQASRVRIDDGARFKGRLNMEVPLPDDL